MSRNAFAISNSRPKLGSVPLCDSDQNLQQPKHPKHSLSPRRCGGKLLTHASSPRSPTILKTSTPFVNPQVFNRRPWPWPLIPKFVLGAVWHPGWVLQLRAQFGKHSSDVGCHVEAATWRLECAKRCLAQSSSLAVPWHAVYSRFLQKAAPITRALALRCL